MIVLLTLLWAVRHVMNSQNWFNLTVLTLLLEYVLEENIVQQFKFHLHEIAENADKGLIMANFKRMCLLINEYACRVHFLD